MHESIIHLILLLIASSALILPLVWRREFSWVDPLALFGGTVLIFAFGKYFYLTFVRPIADQPPWATAADLHNGVWATTVFSLLAIAGYTIVRASTRNGGTSQQSVGLINMRVIYLVALALIAVSTIAFIAILYSSTFAITWETISAKRFLDSELGPAARVGTFEYFLFRATLAARIPLYALFVGVLVRGRMHRLDAVLLTLSFFCIFLTAFIFSNRFNLILVFIDLCAISAIIGRRSLRLRQVLLGLAVFAVVIVASEFRLGESADVSVVEHVYRGRYFTDVARTDRIVDFYQTSEKEGGNTFYSWLLIGVPSPYGDGGLAFLNMGWELGYSVFGLRASGVPPGFVAETYMNFGIAGLLVGGLLFGAVAGYIAVALHNRATPPWLMLFVTLAAIRLGLVLFNGNFGMMAIKVILEAAPAAFILWLATRRSKDSLPTGGQNFLPAAVRG